MAKIVAVNGSPRPNFNTGQMVKSAAKGAEDKGAEIQYFDLYRLEKYTGCISCFRCMKEPTYGVCAYRDGLSPVLDAIREADGLALSSRNRLLSEECRAAAPQIYAALQAGASSAGTKSIEEVCRDVVAGVERSGLLKVIYFSLVDEKTLLEVSDWSDAEHVRGCIAVQAGNVRLIDNMRFV